MGVTLIVVVMPRTASFFTLHSGTQNEWMTSLDVSTSSVGSLSGRTSSPADTFSSGYVKVQANCWLVTSTTRWSAGSRSTS